MGGFMKKDDFELLAVSLKDAVAHAQGMPNTCLTVNRLFAKSKNAFVPCKSYTDRYCEPPSETGGS